MSKVTIAVAADITEADEIRRVLAEAGIASALEAVETDMVLPAGDGPCRVLVEAGAVESAGDVLSGAYDVDGDHGGS